MAEAAQRQDKGDDNFFNSKGWRAHRRRDNVPIHSLSSPDEGSGDFPVSSASALRHHSLGIMAVP